MPKLITLLDDCAWTIVYQTIVATLKADSMLSQLIPARQWTTYMEDDGNPIRNQPYDNRGLPAIRLLPTGSPVTTETNTRQNAPLTIGVTLTTDGHDVRDAMNLWGAFVAAVLTGDGVKALGAACRAALKAAADARGKFVGSLETINLSPMTINAATDQGGLPFMTVEASITANMTVPK